MKSLELLAPAKDLEHGRAAILCGADAVYVGAPRYSARSATGVSVEQIEELCRFAHQYEAKVYIAMNTIIFEDELEEAEHIATEVYNAGADALIIQDMAFLRMKDLPPIELHASTQCFNMDDGKIKFLFSAGFSRIILERALSVREIADIHKEAPCIELEAFIHGAICVSYSGRCYMSRTMSQRSGNRGVCVQSCRLPYNLLDERLEPIVKDKHLLSVQDMNLSENLAEMIDAGVTSFKIEGRLKDMDYVKNIVTWYRKKLDEIILSHSGLTRSSKGISSVDFEPDPRKSFSRGATSYYISDTNNKVASFETPKSSGEYIGTVTNIRRDFFEVENRRAAATTTTSATESRTAGGTAPLIELASGDGICFFDREGKLIGTNINRSEGAKIYPNRMDGIERGTEIYRNYDHLFVTGVVRSRMKRTIGIKAKAKVSSSVIELTFSENETSVTVIREGSFEPAQNKERAEETLRTQISKTGDSIYSVSEIDMEWDEVRFIPSSFLNEIRREAVERLTEARMETLSKTRALRKEEDRNAVYPADSITGEENVTNSLAEQFYRDHGVKEIEKGYDLADDLTGCRVMQMRYCARREMNQCLKENPAYKGKLYIENGLNVYELDFDCARCSANLIYRGKREKKQAR